MTINMIDELNQILINCLHYQAKLQKLCKNGYDEQTARKLEEFRLELDRNANELMKLIKDSGGKIQTTPRFTDRDTLRWCVSPIPSGNNMVDLISYLINIQQGAISQYTSLLEKDGLSSSVEGLLQRHIKQARANEDYLEVALQTDLRE